MIAYESRIKELEARCEGHGVSSAKEWSHRVTEVQERAMITVIKALEGAHFETSIIREVVNELTLQFEALEVQDVI